MESERRIEIEVKLFAALREAYGASVATLSVPAGTTVGSLPGILFAERRASQPDWPGPVLYAVERRYVPPETVLKAGVEVALVPPLGGG